MIEHLKSRATMVDVLNYYQCGPPVGTATQRWKCPVHNDNTPSLVVYADGHAHCYACGFHAPSAIDLVARMHNVEPAKNVIGIFRNEPEAFPEIQHLAGITKPARPHPLEIRRPTLQEPEEAPDRQLALLWRKIRELTQNAQESVEYDYWKQRQVRPAVAKDCGLIDIERVLHKLTSWATGTFSRSHLVRMGWLSERGFPRWGTPRNPYSLVIPGFDERGNITAMQFRRRLPHERGPRFMSISANGFISPQSSFLFRRGGAQKPLLVEGAADVASVSMTGKLDVIGLMGINNMEPIFWLPRTGITELYIGFDRREPVNLEAPEEQAALEIANILKVYGIWCYRVYSRKKDWNETLVHQWALHPDRVPDINELIDQKLSSEEPLAL